MNITETRPVVFTAQSKAYFYCRDAVCQFVFDKDAIPLNPFRVFEYFLGDRVDRDKVRLGNNNLIKLVDEVWVFGETIADGVLFEIGLAHELGKPLRFYTIENRANLIRPVRPNEIRFEKAVYSKTRLSKAMLLSKYFGHNSSQLTLPLPNGRL